MTTACNMGQISLTGFVAKHGLQNTYPLFSVPRTISPLSSSFWALNKVSHHSLKVSSEGQNTPGEEGFEDDLESKFVPLNPEDPRYGPPALLLIGFQIQEANKIEQLLTDLEGDFLKVIYCAGDMIGGSLWNAVNTAPQNLERIDIARSVPRICFLSGLTGEEMMMFIEAFQEIDIEPAVFAALVPNSAHKSLLQLMEEIMADHEMARQQETILMNSTKSSQG